MRKRNKIWFVHLLVFLHFFNFCLNTDCLAQGEANNWYFGQHAGISFNSGVPVALTNGALSTDEGCASISDKTGNLLFYTDGMNVYNRNHQQMPNGFGLTGNPSSAQSGIIVPKPGYSSIYYIFTVDAFGSNNGFRYSEVDLNLNSGMGDVITATKNTLLFTPCVEKIAAVKHANGLYTWIIAHGFDNNSYYAFLVDCNGINNPIITNIGQVEGWPGWGYLAVSSDGTKLASAMRSVGFELLNFDNATGIISNPVLLSNPGGAYGISFSPDNSLLYALSIENGQIYQWNLNAGSYAAIINSIQNIGTGQGVGGYLGGAIQRGPDNKLYIPHFQQPYLSVINNPNVYGTACNLQHFAVDLSGRNAVLGLPPFIQSFFDTTTISYSNNCVFDFTQFNLSYDPSLLDSVYWDFGDSNSSNIIEPTHQYSIPGQYNVTLIRYISCISDTHHVVVKINPAPSITITPNQASICAGDSVTLTANIGSQTCSLIDLPPNLQQGLVAFYPFCGNANDESGNCNNGILYNSPVLTTDRFGNANNAYLFNGIDQYIKASANPLPSAERTVAVWFYTNNITNSPNIVGYGGNTCGTSWMQGLGHWGSPSFSVTCHCNYYTLQYPYPNPSGPVGNWYHFVITTNPTGTKIYVNGVLTTSNSNFISNTFVLGKDLGIAVASSPSGYVPYSDNNVKYFNGKIDDVFIYNRTLSNLEITQLYQLENNGSLFWSTGETTQSIIVNPSQTTTYTATSTMGGCAGTASTTITVNPSFTLYDTIEICDGQIFSWHGNNLFTSGTYYDSLQIVNGCDSVYTLVLTVNPTYAFSENQAICNGDSYNWRGNMYNAAGTYYDSLQTINGCDSVYKLNLIVHPKFEYIQTDEICDNEIFTWRGINYTTQGIYYDSLFTEHGCDSVYVLNLTVYPTYEFLQNENICDGQVLNWHGNNYNTASIYYDSLLTTSGCDSVYILNLIVNPVYEFEQNEEICDGEVLNWQGINYSAAGTYYDSLLTTSSCDSVLVLKLIVNPVYEFVQDEEICDSDVFSWRGNNYSTAGTYYDSLLTEHGCDSVYVLNLTVRPSYEFIQNENICDGHVFNWHGYNYTMAGNYYNSLLTINGCDSVFVLNLTVNPLFEFVEVEEICFGNSFLWHGNSYSTAGTYYDSLFTVLGCDSVYVLNLIVNPVYEFVQDEEICDGNVFSWRGNNYSTAGTYYDSLLTVNGCDSLYVLNLIVHTEYEMQENGEICEGQSYTWRNNDFIIGGTYYDSLQTVYGCDSVYVLNLTVNPLPVANAGKDTSICSGDSTLFNATGGLSYLWSPAISLSANDIFNPIASPSLTTTYTVYVTDINGCTAADSLVIDVLLLPSIDFDADVYSGCPPLLANFSGISNQIIQSWLWNFGDQSSPNNTSSQQNPSHLFAQTGIYSISLNITTPDGCTNTLSKPYYIEVYSNPTASFTFYPPFADIQNPVITFYNQSVDASAWLWHFGDDANSVSSDESPQHYYIQPGTYTVWLIVETPYGCTDSTSAEIIYRPEYTFYIPNAFSPNGDGLNDNFGPKGIGIDLDNYEMHIYDRWGKQIFKTADINELWDGKVKEAEIAPAGVYTWVVFFAKTNDVDRHLYRYSGSVTLLR